MQSNPQGFSVIYRNPGHWDIYRDGVGRAFRVRGRPGDVMVSDEQSGHDHSWKPFKTVSAAMAWVLDEFMFQQIAEPGDRLVTPDETPLVAALTPAPSYAEGLEAAALHVEKRLDAYMADHGVYDPLLGGLMEDIRALAGKPPAENK